MIALIKPHLMLPYLYSQSEQFRRSEKSEPEAIQKSRVKGVFQSAGQRFASVLKKIL